MIRKNGLFRLICAAVLICFTTTNVAWAAGGDSFRMLSPSSKVPASVQQSAAGQSEIEKNEVNIPPVPSSRNTLYESNTAISLIVLTSLAFLSGCAEVVMEHPILSVATGIVGVGLAALAAWRIFFPVSWYLWKLKRNSYGTNAIEKLSKQTDQRSIAAMLKAFNKNSNVRRSVIEILAKINPPELEQLLKRAIMDENSWVRGEAVTALGQIKSPQTMELLAVALKDTNPYVRRNAIDLLKKLGDRQAIELLVAMMGEDSDSSVSLEAGQALSQLGWEPSNEASRIRFYIATSNWGGLIKLGKPAVEVLLTHLEDQSIQLYVINSLGKIGDHRAIAPMMDLFSRTPAMLTETQEYTDSYGQTSYWDVEVDNPLHLAIKRAIDEIEFALMRTADAKTKSWHMGRLSGEVPPFQLETRESITALLSQRNWLWNSRSDQLGRKAALDKIMLIQSKLEEMVRQAYALSVSPEQIVSVYLIGSYPWVEEPNDLDLVFVIKGKHANEFISSERLSGLARTVLGKDIVLNIEVVGLESLREIAEGTDRESRVGFVTRSRATLLYGGVLLGGVDLYRSAKPPLENFTVLRDELLRNAETGVWFEIQNESAKVAAKKRWRFHEAAALEKMFGLEPKAADRVVTVSTESSVARRMRELQEGHARAVDAGRTEVARVLAAAIESSRLQTAAAQAAQRELAEAGSALQERQNELTRLTAELDQLQAQVAEMRQAHQQKETYLAAAQEARQNLLDAVNELREGYESAVRENISAVAEVLGSAFQGREQELQSAQIVLDQRQQAFGESETALNGLTQNVQAKNDQIAALRRQIESLSTRLGEWEQTTRAIESGDFTVQRALEVML